MTDRAVREIAAEIASLKRQVHGLATNARAPFTSVQNGRTRWLDNGGVEEVVIGVNDAGQPILRVHNDDMSARVLLMVDGVLKAPIGTATWQRDMNLPIDGNGRPLISSGSYVAGWSTYVYAGAKALSTTATLGIGGGVTSAAARVTAFTIGYYDSDGGIAPGGGGTQTVKEWTGITTTSQLDVTGGPWPFPDALRSPPASVAGSVLLLQFEARVTGGAGNIYLAPSPVLVSGSGS